MRTVVNDLARTINWAQVPAAVGKSRCGYRYCETALILACPEHLDIPMPIAGLPSHSVARVGTVHRQEGADNQTMTLPWLKY